MKCAYAGSFDPFHFGHQHIVERATNIFDRTDVLVANNPKKHYTLPKDARVSIIVDACKHIPGVRVIDLPNNLLVSDYCKANGIGVVIKGIRNLQDTEYEKILHEITVSQVQGIDTAVLFSKPEDHKISSTAIKELVGYNADIRDYASMAAKSLLEWHQNSQIIVGITGTIGSGKSFISSLFGTDGGQCKVFPEPFAPEFHHIDVDEIIREITYGNIVEGYGDILQLRQQTEYLLGVPLVVDGKPNSKEIGKLIFNNRKLNSQICELYKPTLVRVIRNRMARKSGVILIDSAFLIDSDLSYLCNNQIILVDCPENTIIDRLKLRYNDNANEVYARYQSQLTNKEKKEAFNKIMERDGFGTLLILDNGPSGLMSITDKDKLQKVIAKLLEPILVNSNVGSSNNK